VTDTRLLDLVDRREFRNLFVEELGWNNPDRPDVVIAVDETAYTLSPVASYKGLRIWHCPMRPTRKVQRQIDLAVGKENQERLIIFTNTDRQDWRWPRPAQLGGTNAKLLVHEHVTGDRNTHLTQRLRAIQLDFDAEVSLVALLDRMRDAFDKEAETAAVAAARLMGTLYAELDGAGVDSHDATLLLARLLFLLFGDDADMWKPEKLFEHWLATSTTAETLHTALEELFDVLNTPDRQRSLPEGSALARFRYINGGLYADPLTLPPLTGGFRDGLLAACDFDWSIISPAVFGSMFQTVKNREARRTAGEHYTTEQNILKTIRPLFLDDYRDRLDESWDDPKQLAKLHTDLAAGRYIDPACGCGNFLVVAYRELRALELELLKRLRDIDMAKVAAGRKVERAQLSLDVTKDVKVRLDHFYGIEIEEWPARIAETAMLLVDHLSNQQMALEFGVAPDPLPITVAPTIYHGNALRVDWNSILPASDSVVVLGNPPFKGWYTRTEEQGEDARRVWGADFDGYLDYVTAWHAKTLGYLANTTKARWAFVTTNSITQGQAVPGLFRPIFRGGWRILFAHRTFPWRSEAADQAAVHCVIVGFTKDSRPKPKLFVYDTPHAEPRFEVVTNINPYLLDASNLLVDKRTNPLRGLPDVRYGNKPADGGFLSIKTAEEYGAVMADPLAAKYVRPFIGADELLNGAKRWCLWLEDASVAELRGSPVLRARLDGVREMRLKSPKESTRLRAQTPHLFDQVRQPADSYLAIPRHVSENRRYFTATRFAARMICGDANFTAIDPDGYLFAIISSTMFITWQRMIGGRIKSDLRFSNTVVWNNFPMPEVSAPQRDEIITAGKLIVSVRARTPDRSLADLYEPADITADLIEAHDRLDAVVDAAFGAPLGCRGELERQEILFSRYEQLAGIADVAAAGTSKTRRK
jgi:hypothetical protein